MRRATLSAAAVLATALAGCGGSSAPAVHVVRPAHPVWCPAEIKVKGKVQQAHGAFDARAVLGRSLDDAVRLGQEHRCTVRPTTIDGKDNALTMDLRPDRVNVVVEHGKVTRFDTVVGPIG